MKAKDITTPGDYEVKHYKGPRKAHIVKVEQRSIRVYQGRSVTGHHSSQWRAIELAEGGKEVEWPLGQVLRPWAEAAPDHAAKDAFHREGRRAADDLRAVLAKQGLTPNVSTGEGVHITVTLNRRTAQALTALLNKLPAD